MRRVAAKCFSSILAGILLAGASALAQTPQERRWCEGEDVATTDQRIEGCSAVIKAGREKGEKLAEAFNNRGVAHRLKGEYDRAIQDYNQAIRLDAKFAMAFNNRGVAYDKKGEYDRAIQDYEQSIKLKPSPEAHLNRGNAHLGKSQYDHAIDDYNQAIKLKADFAPAFDNRCWARAVVGILKPALADCNEALRLMPNNAATLDSRGRLPEDDSLRCRGLRLQRSLADQPQACLRALWSRPGEIEERRPLGRDRHRGSQVVAG